MHGLGPAKAAQIKAAIELGYRLLKENPELKDSISSPADAADLIRYKMQALAAGRTVGDPAGHAEPHDPYRRSL